MEDPKVTTLRPIRISTEDFDRLEARIKALFKKLLYGPILRELDEPVAALKNTIDSDELADAIRTGRITFSRGSFAGRFNSSISKELKRLGAQWDRKTRTWKIPQSNLPTEVRGAISASEARFEEKLESIDRRLGKILPEEISSRLEAADLFDRTLWKTHQEFAASVKGITVAPQLTPESRKRIADEWETNMRLWVKEFTEKEILELRQKMKASVFAGNRFESAIETIQKSYGVSANKAKFLARQETSLLLTKYGETLYRSAGVDEYKWVCVTGTKAHPVRPVHKALADASKKGKIFTWDNPPITTEPGQPTRRNNPGQDYNCRCYAQPVVRFSKK